MDTFERGVCWVLGTLGAVCMTASLYFFWS